MPVAGGDRPNAIDINGLEVTTAVTGATVGVVSAGFTVASALVRTALRGKLIYLKLDLVWTAGTTISATYSATGANIGDTTCFTIAAAYRPTELTSTIFSANPGTGEVQINADGTCVLRTSDASIAAGANVRMVHSYLQA
jgi:hypothetical protein